MFFLLVFLACIVQFIRAEEITDCAAFIEDKRLFTKKDVDPMLETEFQSRLSAVVDLYLENRTDSLGVWPTLDHLLKIQQAEPKYKELVVTLLLTLSDIFEVKLEDNPVRDVEKFYSSITLDPQLFLLLLVKIGHFDFERFKFFTLTAPAHDLLRLIGCMMQPYEFEEEINLLVNRGDIPEFMISLDADISLNKTNPSKVSTIPSRIPSKNKTRRSSEDVNRIYVIGIITLGAALFLGIITAASCFFVRRKKKAVVATGGDPHKAIENIFISL